MEVPHRLKKKWIDVMKRLTTLSWGAEKENTAKVL